MIVCKASNVTSRRAMNEEEEKRPEIAEILSVIYIGCTIPALSLPPHSLGFAGFQPSF